MDLFFAGMLSHLDAMIGCDMADAIADLHLADDVRTAPLRLGGFTPPGTALALVEAHEKADWEMSAAICERTGVPQVVLPAAYLSAIAFGREIASA